MQPFSRSRAYQAFLNGNKKMVRTPADYERWRRTVPFTDEQIVTALRAYGDTFAEGGFTRNDAYFQAAELERTGMFSAITLGMALQMLVKECNVCGKKALYRIGNEGRCKEHKAVPEKFTQIKYKRFEEKSKVLAKSQARFDQFQLSHLKVQATAKIGKKKRS